MKMKQLDLFLDTDIRYYDDLLSDVTDENLKKETIDKSIKWRAEELNLSLEKYLKWIKKD